MMNGFIFLGLSFCNKNVEKLQDGSQSFLLFGTDIFHHKTLFQSTCLFTVVSLSVHKSDNAY